MRTVTKHGTLSEFEHAYITTALWSTNDESTPQGGEPLDANYDADDLAPEAAAKMLADCRQFLDANEATIDDAIESGDVKYGPDFGPMGRAGHDFWLTRNGHGAGFWDGDWPEPAATILTDAAHKAGECNIYVGDDGKLYVQ